MSEQERPVLNPVPNPEDPEPGRTSVRLSPAYLRWHDKDHLALYRKAITVTNEGGNISRTESPHDIGPLGVYREARRGDKVDMRTNDPVTGRPMELTLVWKPGMVGGP